MDMKEKFFALFSFTVWHSLLWWGFWSCSRPTCSAQWSFGREGCAVLVLVNRSYQIRLHIKNEHEPGFGKQRSAPRRTTFVGAASGKMKLKVAVFSCAARG